MPISMTRDQVQKTLIHARTVRAEFDSHKAETLDSIRTHLENVSRVCMVEYRAIARDGEIADGNIDAAVNLLNDAIKKLRNIQDTIVAQDNEIQDMVQLLADEEIWQ